MNGYCLSRRRRVRDAIRELHSYELPECISFSVEDGSSDYLDWISESVE